MVTQQISPAPHATYGLSQSVLTWLKLTIRWKRLVFTVACGVAALGVLIAILWPGRYTATAVILPPQQTGSAGSAMMAQLGSLGALAAGSAGGLGIKNPNDQQIALLTSRVVEEKMVARFHLQDVYHRKYLSSTRKQWEKVTKTDPGLKDGLIRLSVTDRDPNRAAEMANAWVEEYRTFSSTMALTEASQRRLFYERELAGAREELVHAEEDMKQTEQRTGVIDLEGQGRSMIASAAVLRGQLAAKQVEMRAMRQFAAEGNPDLQRAEQEAAGMEAQLSAMDAANNRQSGDLIVPKGTVTQAALDYERALREVKYRETLQDLLTRQYEGARVDEARQGALIQVVEPAAVPDRPDDSFRIWIAIGALLFCFPIGLLVGVVAELISIMSRAKNQTGSWPNALQEVMSTW